MTKEELLELYMSMLTNYSMTYEEFRTLIVQQDPDFPGIAKILSTDGSKDYLYEFKKVTNQETDNEESENENDNNTTSNNEQSEYWSV